MSKSNAVKYRVLKPIVIKSCKQVKQGYMDFTVDFEKLTKDIASQNLTPITPVGFDAKIVTPEMIPFLSEYFEKTHLSWFSDSKFYTIITFIQTDAIDDEASELMEKITTPQEQDPNNDKVKAMATLVANYPCYFGTIISYQNGDIDKIGTPSYEVVFRANKVVIKSSDYQYNPKDFS